MTEPTPIVMIGAAGRMGRMILELAAADAKGFKIVGAVDRADHPMIGKPLSELVPGAPADVCLEAEGPAAVPAGAVAIHFSLPDALGAHLSWNVQAGCAAVIGTTGLGDEQKKMVEAAGARIPVLFTPNTSTGVSVLCWLASEATRLLGPGFDVEIIEMHHHNKQDAPSGTARRLAEVICEASGRDYDRDVIHGRVGQVGARTPREIGMHAVRGGDVVGDHTIVFAGAGERIELTHRASSRQTFAAGALRAAAWLSGRRPGFYSMNDALGLQPSCNK
ncbi:4-hydroxy-tetrahydrodipicolinate reductase [bacterium]|nr:4-hydroxy-tetrahydrodipicolinate reductase [bacterium]